MDSAGQVAQFLKGHLDLPVGLVDHAGRGLGVVGELLLRQAEPHGEGDQAGLGAVVQVAFDAAQVGGGGVHHHTPVQLPLGDPRSNSSDGDSSPRTIARSTAVSPRAMNGSTGHRTNRLTSVTPNVSTPHGSRMKPYNNAEPTRFSGPPPTAGRRTPRPGDRAQRTRLLHPHAEHPSGPPPLQPASSRAPWSPPTSSGRPITVTDSPAPTLITTTV
ncbi:hypothetical protein SCALM49S_02257 [Streptomyces californicus]